VPSQNQQKNVVGAKTSMGESMDFRPLLMHGWGRGAVIAHVESTTPILADRHGVGIHHLSQPVRRK